MFSSVHLARAQPSYSLFHSKIGILHDLSLSRILSSLSNFKISFAFFSVYLAFLCFRISGNFMREKVENRRLIFLFNSNCQ